MIRLIITLITSCGILASWAQQQCTVVDGETGEPLPGVTVFVKEGVGAFTNNDGQFTLKAAADDVAHISYVGYRKVNIDVAKLPTVLKLVPLSRELKEVVVTGDDELLIEVAKRLEREYAANRNKLSPFISRMVFRFGSQTEMVEAIMEAAAAGNIRQFSVMSGQYWQLTSDGTIRESELKNTNLHMIYSIGTTIRDTPFLKFLTTPLPKDVSKAYLHREYNITSENITEENGEVVRCFTFVPKGTVLNKVAGKLYVRPSTAQVERFDGVIQGIKTWTRVAESERIDESTGTIRMAISFAQRDGYTQVNTFSFDIANSYGGCHGMMTNISGVEMSNKTFSKRVEKNLVYTIEDVGHNPYLDEYLTITQRTREETSIAAGKAHKEF